MRHARTPIFLSDRRDDTAGYARALNDVLARAFAADRVVIGVDDITAGQAFDDRINQAIGQARVLLVLIGPRWLAPQADGMPRHWTCGAKARRCSARRRSCGCRVASRTVGSKPKASASPPAAPSWPAAARSVWWPTAGVARRWVTPCS